MSTVLVTDKELNTATASWVAELGVTERQQQQHYDSIAADYEVHYSDEWSREYRKSFIYDPMFAGLELSGMKVLDAMCGSGQTTEYFLARGAEVTGLDISNEVISTFRTRWPEATAVKRSLLDSGLPDNSFDCVAIVGGLHHVHPNVKRAMTEVHRILKPGGYVCFMEPHSGSFPDLIRRVWYKFDHYFADNEASIDVTRLQHDFHRQFELSHAKYLGNVAFLLVLNSLIFRVPPVLKKFYSPLALKLESILSKFQFKLNSCFAVAQLRKR